MSNHQAVFHVILLLILVLYTNSQRLTREKLEELLAKVQKLPLDTCGQPPVTGYEERIFGGQAAELGAYPWMAAIGYTGNPQGISWNCGGSVITDQYVLTAAHCLDPAIIQKKIPFVVSVVRLGDLNLDDKIEEKAKPTDFDVEKVLFHSQYDNITRLHDIGLIRLKNKVQFSDFIKPICLPPPEFLWKSFVNQTCQIAGWGRSTRARNDRTTQLQEAQVQIKDTDECRQNITKVRPNVVIDDRVVCAAAPEKDSCQGDSGGPLMLFTTHNNTLRMFVVGVVSYGYGCAVPGYAGVYTRVSPHMGWIMDNMDL